MRLTECRIAAAGTGNFIENRLICRFWHEFRTLRRAKCRHIGNGPGHDRAHYRYIGNSLRHIRNVLAVLQERFFGTSGTNPRYFRNSAIL